MSNVIKFQAPFEKLKFSSNSPDAQIRKAIILQAIIDASNCSDNRELRKYEIEAKSWIFGKSDYFIQICHEGGIEPDFVIKIAREVILLQKKNFTQKKEKTTEKQETQELTTLLYG